MTSRIGRIHGMRPREDCENGFCVWFLQPHIDGFTLTGIGTIEVEELLKHARVLAKHPNKLGAVATSTGDIPGEKRKLLKRQSRKSVVRCFMCQGPHLMRDCKEPRLDIISFWCGQIGHVSRRCLVLQKNE